MYAYLSIKKIYIFFELLCILLIAINLRMWACLVFGLGYVGWMCWFILFRIVVCVWQFIRYFHTFARKIHGSTGVLVLSQQNKALLHQESSTNNSNTTKKDDIPH